MGESSIKIGIFTAMSVFYHLPGLFEFYDLYKAFLPFSASTGNIFTSGVKSAPSTVRPAIACGVVAASDLAMRSPMKLPHS